MDNPSACRLRHATVLVNTDSTGDPPTLPPFNHDVNSYCTFLVTPWSVPGGSCPWRR